MDNLPSGLVNRRIPLSLGVEVRSDVARPGTLIYPRQALSINLEAYWPAFFLHKLCNFKFQV